MGLISNIPTGSGRMGILWTVGTIGETAVLEFGSMGHMIYASKWFQRSNLRHQSQLFTTHIHESDITFGDTTRIDEAVKEIIHSGMKVIFLLPSSVPETIGVDMESVAGQLRDQYPDKTFIAFNKGGMKETLYEGIEEALYKICTHLSFDTQDVSEEIKVNIIGSNLDFDNFHSDSREIQRLLQQSLNIKVRCVLTAETSWSKLKTLTNAQLNIAIRKEGIKACEYLSKKHGIPYVTGRPYGYKGTIQWLEKIAKMLQIPMNESFIKRELEDGRDVIGTLKMLLQYRADTPDIALYGHSDLVTGLDNFLKEDLEWNAVESWSYEDIKEEEIIQRLQDKAYTMVMANQGILDYLHIKNGIAIERNVSSTNYNKYRSPYVGFRGVLHLCDLLIRKMM